MKKPLITVTLLFLFNFYCFSQDSFSKYIGQLVIVKKDATSKEVSGFHKTLDEYGSNNIPYKYEYDSVRDSLTNKKFKCVSITEKEYPYKGYYAELNNDATGTIYYYFEGDILGSEILPLDYLLNKAEYKKDVCSRIEVSEDDMEDKKSFSTPFTSTSVDDAYFIKEITKKGVTTYYLSLSAESSSALATEKGVIILLKNGKKLLKPSATVETDVNKYKHNPYDGDFIRKAFIHLTSTDIQLLATSAIKKFRLYDEDGIPPGDSDNLLMMFQCLLTKK